jgi:phospholipase/carboxylesterase
MTLRPAFAWLLLYTSASSLAWSASRAAAQATPDVAQPAVAVAAPPATPLRDAAPDATGWGVAGGLRYLEIVRGGAKPNEKLPLLLVIHGLGDKPHRGWLEAIDVDSKIKARMILPQAPTAYGDGFAWFPYRAGSLDQAELARGISDAAERLTRMLEVLRTQRPTRGRALVSGFSQGGMLSYALALSHPELVAYAVPISGMLPAQLWPVIAAPAEAHFPALRALHGTADTIVRFSVDDQLVRRLRELGYPAELVPFEGAVHAITPEMSALLRSTLSAALAQPAASPPHGRGAGSPPTAAPEHWNNRLRSPANQ